MFQDDEYCLLDFGGGRRLERFGALVLDRPCPSANSFRPKHSRLWLSADTRFEEVKRKASVEKRGGFEGRGFWRPLTHLGKEYFALEGDDSRDNSLPMTNSRPWQIRFDNKFVLELKGSPFGHIGVFPEQAENWDRIFTLCSEGMKRLCRPPRVLNLFGYTGASALAAAAAGANVAHVDAARNIVAQAKRNYHLSFEPRVGDAGSVRWIVDDAMKFVKREIKRGTRYDGVILDPPTYGHGARGEVWRLSRDLAPLMDNIARLLDGEFGFVILTAHTKGFEAPVLEGILWNSLANSSLNKSNLNFSSKGTTIRSSLGEALPLGDLAIARF